MDLDSFGHLAGLFEAGLTNAVSELKPERAFVAYRGRSPGPSEFPTPYATHGFSMAGLYVNEDISTKVISQTLREGKAQLIVDAISAPGLTNRTSVIISGLRSILSVPIRYSNGLTVGLLYVDNRVKAGAFKESHEEVLTHTAEQLLARLGKVEAEMKREETGSKVDVPVGEVKSRTLSLVEKGHLTEALATVESWIRGREEDRDVGIAYGVRGKVLQRMGQMRSAFESVAIAVFLLGQSSRSNENYALMLNNLASLHVELGNLDRAHGLLRASSSAWEKLVARDAKHHAGLSATCYNLGKLHLERDEDGPAREWLEMALASCEEAFGPEHVRTLKVKEALALCEAEG